MISTVQQAVQYILLLLLHYYYYQLNLTVVPTQPMSIMSNDNAELAYLLIPNLSIVLQRVCHHTC